MLHKGERLCGSCAYKREFEAASAKARAEENARIKDAEERASWPPQSHADRVAEVKVYALREPQKKKPIDVDGAEIASVLLEAGVKPKPQARREGGLFRRELVVNGWRISELDHVAEYDSPRYDREKFILATNGAVWRSRGTDLEQTASPSKMHPAHTLLAIYRSTDTYHDRLKAHMREQADAAAAEERRKYEEYRRSLLKGED